MLFRAFHEDYSYGVDMCHERVRTTSLEHAREECKKSRSGDLYQLQVRKFFHWKMIEAYRDGKRVDVCGCRVLENL